MALVSDFTQSIHLCFGLPLIHLLLLLAVPTLLWGRCDRHNSPPASSVVDILCCSDGSRVRFHTVYPSLLWSSSSSSSPGRCHLLCSSSHVSLFSFLYMLKPPQSRFRDPVRDLLYLHSLLDVLIYHIVSWRVAACQSTHLHLFHFQSLHSRLRYCLHSIEHSCIFPFSCGGIL